MKNKELWTRTYNLIKCKGPVYIDLLILYTTNEITKDEYYELSDAWCSVTYDGDIDNLQEVQARWRSYVDLSQDDIKKEINYYIYLYTYTV